MTEPHLRPICRIATVAVATLALVLTGCQIQHGPDPTEAMLEASSGPLSFVTVTVPSSVGFGGGTIYYPTGERGPYGAISVFPGFAGSVSTVAAWGPKLASNGFVTIIANGSNLYELPEARSTEQLQALDYVVAQSKTTGSPIAGLVDASRLGVMGQSMGGGGTLISAENRPSLKAAVPMVPWVQGTGTNFSGDRVPTLIFACQADTAAPVASFASPIYNSIPTRRRRVTTRSPGRTTPA